MIRRTSNAELRVKTEDQLRAEIRALEMRLGKRSPKLLVDVAEVLQYAEEVCIPAVAAAVTDGTSRGKPESREPVGGDRRARSAFRAFEYSVNQAIQAFWSKASKEWETEKRPPVEKVRCVNRHCDRRDQRIPKEVRVGQSKIAMTLCPACGSKMSGDEGK